MKDLGYGNEYRYAHDEEQAYAAGECYLPEDIQHRQYYFPEARGLEVKISDKLNHLRGLDLASQKQRYIKGNGLQLAFFQTVGILQLVDQLPEQ